eukprot:Pompholyxophrys_punicea_v1_NODE_1418_length_728_cov_1.558692.p2 type:complete len:122 gc:universal NODE_1418_length_728_cov_1.558692:302-667(+)
MQMNGSPSKTRQNVFLGISRLCPSSTQIYNTQKDFDQTFLVYDSYPKYHQLQDKSNKTNVYRVGIKFSRPASVHTKTNLFGEACSCCPSKIHPKKAVDPIRRHFHHSNYSYLLQTGQHHQN